MKKYLDDILVVIGTGLIVYATWQIHPIAGFYAAGISLVVFGFLIGSNGPGRQA